MQLKGKRLRMKKLIKIAITISLLLFPTSITAGITLKDHAGRDVFLENIPSRIVSLAPSITEIIFAIGQGRRLVGITRYCNYPPETLSIPKVGGMIDPDYERILLLKPDIVIISKDGSTRDTLSRIESLGIKTFVLGPRSIPEILDSIRIMGKITGNEQSAESIVNGIMKRMDAIKKKQKGLRKKRILFLIWERPMIAVGAGTFINEMIELAGGINVIRDKAVKYPRLSKEDVLRLNPEVIVLCGDFNADALSSGNGGLSKMIDAIRNRRVFRVEVDYYERPGPRFIEGVEELFQLLHGER